MDKKGLIFIVLMLNIEEWETEKSSRQGIISLKS
jgi:hypothetical protein